MEVLKDLDTKRSGMMNVPIEDARLLRVMALAANAKHVVEIGTSNGYSGLWFCLALQATGGKLTTFEIDAGRAALARENFKRAGVESIVTLVEGDAHKEIARLKGPIDMVFIDAEKQGYFDYLNKLLPLVRPNGLILAHNTANLGSQMKDYIDAVTKNPDLETIFLNTSNQGMAVTVKKPAPPKPAAKPQAAAGREGQGRTRFSATSTRSRRSPTSSEPPATRRSPSSVRERPSWCIAATGVRPRRTRWKPTPRRWIAGPTASRSTSGAARTACSTCTTMTTRAG